MYHVWELNFDVYFYTEFLIFQKDVRGWSSLMYILQYLCLNISLIFLKNRQETASMKLWKGFRALCSLTFLNQERSWYSLSVLGNYSPQSFSSRITISHSTIKLKEHEQKLEYPAHNFNQNMSLVPPLLFWSLQLHLQPSKSQ